MTYIKVTAEKRPEMFVRVFDNCLRAGEFPVVWKRANLVLLPKPGKPPGLPSIYRPLCMLDTTGKLFEKIVYNRL